MSLKLHENSSSKVKTQWVLSEPEKYTNVMPSALNMNKFENISKLLTKVNSHEDTVGPLADCLINYYATGASRSGPHADDESYNDQSKSICTFSLGHTREFGIFSKDSDNNNSVPLRTYIH